MSRMPLVFHRLSLVARNAATMVCGGLLVFVLRASSQDARRGTSPIQETASNPPSAQPIERNVDGIMDNSFLVEEAYNQEAGVVQHIFTAAYSVDQLGGPDDKIWNLTFTQEWPVFSQTHQFSYTVPYSYSRSGGLSDDGFGDVLL